MGLLGRADGSDDPSGPSEDMNNGQISGRLQQEKAGEVRTKSISNAVQDPAGFRNLDLRRV